MGKDVEKMRERVLGVLGDAELSILQARLADDPKLVAAVDAEITRRRLLKPREACDPMDRSRDQPAPSYPGNANHAAMHRVVECPACKRRGKLVTNGNGMSPPHGWWIAPGSEAVYCSSECIAQVRPHKGPKFVTAARKRPR